MTAVFKQTNRQKQQTKSPTKTKTKPPKTSKKTPTKNKTQKPKIRILHHIVPQLDPESGHSSYASSIFERWKRICQSWIQWQITVLNLKHFPIYVAVSRDWRSRLWLEDQSAVLGRTSRWPKWAYLNEVPESSRSVLDKSHFRWSGTFSPWTAICGQVPTMLQS